MKSTTVQDSKARQTTGGSMQRQRTEFYNEQTLINDHNDGLNTKMNEYCTHYVKL